MRVCVCVCVFGWDGGGFYEFWLFSYFKQTPLAGVVGFDAWMPCILSLPTSHDQLALVLHRCGLVPGYAGVIPVVHQGEVGNPQGAREVDVVDGHPEARGDRPAVLLPGDGDGQVP